MDNTERILERVRRLLAIADDPAASDNEQRIAMERAQKLMDEHAIAEWQLEQKTGNREKIIERTIRFELKPINSFKKDLAMIVAKANRCQVAFLFGKARNGRCVIGGLTFYGTANDIDKAETIWTAMEVSRSLMWRRRARENGFAPNAAWRNGYYLGFQEEISRRYDELRKDMESSNTGHELILTRDRAVNEYIENNVHFSGTYKSSARKCAVEAVESGRRDGADSRLGLTETTGRKNYELTR